LGRNEEALASYDQALKLQPDYYQAWYNRGILVGRLSTYNGYYQQQFVELFYLEIAQVSQQLIPTLENTDLERNLNHFQKSLTKSQALNLKAFTNSEAPEIINLIQKPPPDKLSQLIQLTLPSKLVNLIQKPLSEQVRGQLEQDCLSHPPRFNSQLNLRGYEGAIASYQAELDKAICQDTRPLGWGTLHHGIGKAHYRQGQIPFDSSNQIGYSSISNQIFPQNERLTAFQYWHKAFNSYHQALLTLTEDDYPEEHLEVLQDLIKVHLVLGQTETAEQLRLKGLEVLFSLLNSKKSFILKKQLRFKFISFYQLEVDILVNKGAFSQALTKAELSKNICLINILSTWQENVLSPSCEQIQQLLIPGTAIVCWHISPQVLTTFVLKANATEPIVINDSVSNQEQLSHSLLSLQEFRVWLNEWNQQYQDYRGKTKDQQERDRANHLWRKGMIPRLKQLKTILDIDKIKSYLSDITRLILIPHQDLHRLPLHVLFEASLTQITEDKSLTINYFPSAQIALTLHRKQANHQSLSLLSVENPANDLPYAEIESTIINQMFTNSTSIGTETATNPAVKAALQQPHHIFHFTGHGAYNQRQPENSFLSLTKEHQITAQEISNLNLKSYQLISLSACETGITGNQTIDTEYVGLVSAFLQAGAASVLHTLWTVEEISSAWLMIRFYQLFLEGIAPASALQQAQQWLRTRTYAQLVPWIDNLATTISDSYPNIGEYLQTIIWDIQQDSDKIDSNSPPYAHPYYWAAFTLTGGNIQ
ncbi:CHAT domain-containing protein, partial [Hyella patelloides]|uniref:CHAT domain-containing protein n=1 Tax=Hyella patelloides TaxID=1982969 RepID=UPI0016437C25